RSCVTLKKNNEVYYYIHEKKVRVIAYLLGELTPNSTKIYHDYCPFVEIREFNYSKYPEYFRKLREFRWKPLIIAEHLEKSNIIFWFDASVVFGNGKETLQDIVKSLNTKYKTCGFRILSNSGHKIRAATNPRMYNYFSVNDNILQLNMVAATVFVISKTPEAVKILERVVKCALIEDCMGPPNSTTSCAKQYLYRGEYANCNRYDQSALALSLAQCSVNLRDYFGISDLLYVKRMWLTDNDWIELKEMFPWMNKGKDKLNRKLIWIYHKYCPFVEMKEFHFEKYPKYVTRIKEFRWKPLIVAEYLYTNDVVFWFDTSVVFQNGNETLKAVVESLNTKYTTCGFRILSRTGHKIVAATDPRMFNFFLVDEDILDSEMAAATVFIVSKTLDALKILQNVVQCALVEDCMGPTNATLDCKTDDLWIGNYADCHRFDQSALALSLAQYSPDATNYLGISDMLFVKRITMGDEKEWIELQKRFPRLIRRMT
ncbi:hypothetical protein FO519_009593, partial [Halicephalobus sp. NKZ332]